MSNQKEYRIHIGNISPKLKENSNLLEQRISKFDLQVISPLEFHTKPIETKYFAYTTVLGTPADFNTFKSSLNGVQFMGLKLSIGIAKPSFRERFHNLLKNKSEQLQQDEIKQAIIAQSRLDRITELNTSYPTNPITSSIVTAPKPTVHSVSQHTFNNASATTKNPPPSHRLDGSKSYGATLDRLNFKYRNGSAHSLVKGVHRRNARKDLRLQTLRILVNGELKTFKFYKTKLWGVEKNKTVRDLTWRYDAKMGWKSGDDHLIEGITRNSCGINGKQASKYGQDAESHAQPSDGHKDADDDADNEARKNKAILASLMSSYNFDKPVNIEEDKDVDMDEIEVDSKGRKKVKHYDYEVEGKAGDENDEEEASNPVEKSDDTIALALNNVDLVKPVKEVYYDEDDEGNELDFDMLKPTVVAQEDVGDVANVNGLQEQKNLDASLDFNREEKHDDDDEDEDDEFTPSFGAPASNNTETLRSLFNPTTTSDTQAQSQSQQPAFKLALSDDDHDLDESKLAQDQLQQQQEQQQLLAQIQQRKQEEVARVLQQQRQTQYGLFWPHLESPFLSTQSQLSKIDNLGEFGFALPQLSKVAEGSSGGGAVEKEGETEYEKWFWSVRGEFSRECKRRKRDLMRIMRKKRS